MKPRASRPCFAILLNSVCAIPLAFAYFPAQQSGQYQPPVHGSCTTACGAALRSSVIGVYGGTVVDQLSNGAVVLVKWPNGSPHETWTARSRGSRLPADPATNATHVFFLWPEA